MNERSRLGVGGGVVIENSFGPSKEPEDWLDLGAPVRRIPVMSLFSQGGPRADEAAGLLLVGGRSMGLLPRAAGESCPAREMGTAVLLPAGVPRRCSLLLPGAAGWSGDSGFFGDDNAVASCSISKVVKTSPSWFGASLSQKVLLHAIWCKLGPCCVIWDEGARSCS